MNEAQLSAAETRAAPRRTGPRRLARAWEIARTSPLAAFAVLVLATFVLLAIFADVVAPYDPKTGDYANIRKGPSADHLFGTDDVGRDVLSRVIHGARVSLFVGFCAVLIGDGIGLASGVVGGYVGRRFDLISQRLLEVILAFPGLILASVLVIALGPGLQTVIVAIAVTRIPASNRVVRSVVLSLRNQEFVDAARVAGASPARIMIRHVAPQCIAPFLVIASVHMGISITSEAALSFLGIGVPPPAPSWGTMLGGAISGQFNPPWWLAVFPGLAITLTVFSVNITGDTLRDLFDPRLRGRTMRT